MLVRKRKCHLGFVDLNIDLNIDLTVDLKIELNVEWKRVLGRNKKKCRMSFGTSNVLFHVGLQLEFDWLKGFRIANISSNFERCFE